MTELIDLFSDPLFEVLKSMDAEAVTGERGPTGLSWYGGHMKPHQTRPQTEPCWNERLASLLPEVGFPADHRKTYPCGGRQKCDLVVTMPDNSSLWLEIKGAWPHYWGSRKHYIYRSYLFHPLLPDLDPKTHTVPLDLVKLSILTQTDAKYAGVLLLGFDSDKDPMDEDVVLLTELAGLDRSPWRMRTSRWQAFHRDGENVKCWLWVKAV